MGNKARLHCRNIEQKPVVDKGAELAVAHTWVEAHTLAERIQAQPYRRAVVELHILGRAGYRLFR